MLTNKERSYLSGQASKQHETFSIGKTGITKEIISQVMNDLKAHELVKGKIQKNSSVTPEEAAEVLARETDSEVVRTIGNKFILYKKNPEARHPILP